ncbi:MAG: M24 family metallopeptidase [Pseudomonadota bacterium]
MIAQKMPFSGMEYNRRLMSLRAAMAKKNIDLLFVEDPSNIAWITGYDGWSFYTHQGAVVFHDRDPIWWGRTQDARGALRTVWMKDEDIIYYPDHFVQSTTHHPMEDLADKIRDWGYEGKAIGLEMENYYFTVNAYLTLQKELPNAKLIDATALTNWCRAVKSDEEIGFMRNAALISQKIMTGIMERAEPGLKKNKLVGEIYRDAMIGIGDVWGDYPAIVPLLPSGKDASASHLTWDGRELQHGEATFFEISGCYRRYHAPFCRTLFLGEPPQDMQDASKALIDGLEAGLQAAKAGNLAGDVARALKAELKKAGINREGRVGYPIGLSYPPDWGERTISFREEDETVLEPGMSFHFMPGLWMADWGLETTESILIKDDGPAEALIDFSRKLFVKS